jgi:hypothetical protein
MRKRKRGRGKDNDDDEGDELKEELREEPCKPKLYVKQQVKQDATACENFHSRLPIPPKCGLENCKRGYRLPLTHQLHKRAAQGPHSRTCSEGCEMGRLSEAH